jgi:hypothetical protein
MKRLVALILGIKLLLLVGSIYFDTPETETVEAYYDPRPIVEIMTTTEYEAYLERKEIQRQKEAGEYWTEERIIEAIRATFPESPDTAVAIAKCESGLNPTIQSYHQLSYGRERSFGLMQVHEPDWGVKANQLGYFDWKTDVDDNLKMARYIFEAAGNSWKPWSCSRMI